MAASAGSSTLTVLVLAGVIGASAGIGSLVLEADGRTRATAVLHQVGVMAGPTRRREPQRGDHWRGCDDARAVGTAPIYRDEPGYASTMDGDCDGIACEPRRDR